MTPSPQTEAGARHTRGPYGYWPSYSGEENTFEVGPSQYETIAHVRMGADDVPGDPEANARLFAAAPDLYAAAAFAKAAMEAIQAYEADLGDALPDDHEIGRVEDSRGSPSFRISVGHIRRLAAALSKAEGRS